MGTIATQTQLVAIRGHPWGATVRLLALGYGAVFAVPSADGERTYNVHVCVPFDRSDATTACPCPAGSRGGDCRHAAAVRARLETATAAEIRGEALCAALGAARGAA